MRIAGIVLTCLGLLIPFKAVAQEPIGQDSQVLTRLTQDYLFQADLYQKAKTQFDLDKAEYLQLQTLISREEVVSSYKVMAKHRALAQLAYMAATEQVLAETVGVNPIEKAEVLDRLNQARAFLVAHESELAAAANPEQINIKAKEISTSMASVYRTQYALLSLIAISRVDYSYQRLVSTVNQFEATHIVNQPNSSLKDFLSRGVNDVKLENTKIDQVLTTAGKSYDQMFVPNNRGEFAKPTDIYNQVTKDLQPFLGHANQSIRYLRELERQQLRENGSK